VQRNLLRQLIHHTPSNKQLPVRYYRPTFSTPQFKVSLFHVIPFIDSLFFSFVLSFFFFLVSANSMEHAGVGRVTDTLAQLTLTDGSENEDPSQEDVREESWVEALPLEVLADGVLARLPFQWVLTSAMQVCRRWRAAGFLCRHWRRLDLLSFFPPSSKLEPDGHSKETRQWPSVHKYTLAPRSTQMVGKMLTSWTAGERPASHQCVTECATTWCSGSLKS
jgi:hypothetical protein